MKTERKVIESVLKNKTKLKINGYVNSKGGVADLTLDLSKDKSYEALKKESFNALQAGELDHVKEWVIGISEDEWAQAKRESLASWSKPTQSRATKDVGEDVGGYRLAFDNGKEILRLDGAVLIERTGDISESNYRNNVTHMKAMLKKAAPIGKYIGQVIIRDGKFTSLEEV